MLSGFLISHNYLVRGPLTFDGWYPRDHKPGEYPTTDEERRAAAIKYGLRPEDYQPMSKNDVVRYAGDYPDLGIITYDHKDPYEAWTDRQNRRNWGEMVPIDMMRYRGDRLTFTGLEAEDFTTWGSIMLCLRVLVPMALLSWYFCSEDPNAFRWKNPAMPKQYPYDFYRAFPYDDARKFPITNYSFDLVD
ncbi:NADH-ubiquinone oxidoreductase ASHI subunit [Ancylostoma caninum]|uniref:NADH-ubiquinone oxidoreductase ASHI subunit n=1 Tax=Ancylostoma caninum TaxID=29170 RepID=A0A368FVX8_ANCCA|nr:NADH-ubiquinone oxidoreductase ASHI subunit [Ancylostoma caninum]